MAINPGVPANNSPRLSPVLNSRATRRALAIGSFLCMDSLVTTRYTFILLNRSISLRFDSFTTCLSRYHEDNHSSLIPSPLQISSSSAAFTPCPMRLSLDDRFDSLTFRKNASFAVLFARLDHEKKSLSCLLPRFWYDNLESVPSWVRIFVARQFPAFCTSVACIRTS